MKFILAIFLLSTLLFSLQRQVIVGSYAIKDNAQDALVILNKLIQTNAGLGELVEKEQLKVMNKHIGDYSVVSIKEFESYVHTYEIMKMLKPYYDDIYSIAYINGGIENKEYFKDVEKRALEETKAIQQEEKSTYKEIIIEETNVIEQEEKRTFQEIITEETKAIQEEEEKKMFQEIITEEIKVIEQEKKIKIQEKIAKKSKLISQDESIEELLPIGESIEDNTIEEVVLVVEPMNTANVFSDNNFEAINPVSEKSDIDIYTYYIIIGFIFLLLILGGVIISKQFIDKGTKE